MPVWVSSPQFYIVMKCSRYIVVYVNVCVRARLQWWLLHFKYGPDRFVMCISVLVYFTTEILSHGSQKKQWTLEGNRKTALPWQQQFLCVQTYKDIQTHAIIMAQRRLCWQSFFFASLNYLLKRPLTASQWSNVCECHNVLVHCNRSKRSL